MGLSKKNTAARDGARRGLSDPGDQVGGIAAMGAGRALFILPAGDGLGKGFVGIGPEEIPDILIIFELGTDFGFPGGGLFQQKAIGFYGFGIGFAGIGLQPSLEGHTKGKGLPDFRQEEGPMGFGTDEIFLDAGFPGDGAGGNGLSPAGGRGGQGFAIQKTGDAIRQSGFTARGGQAVFPAEGGQLFLQIIIGAEGFAIRQLVQGRSFVQGRGVLRRVSPSFSR